MPLIQSLKYWVCMDSLEEHKATRGRANTFGLVVAGSSDTLQPQEAEVTY